MRNKLKTVIVVTSVVLLGLGSYIYFFGRKSDLIIGIPNNNSIVGDVARYVEYQSCDEYSKAVVEKFEIEKSKIHSCTSSKVEGQDYFLVEIEFGEAQDCPAGCFYESNVFKVSEDKKLIEEFVDGINFEE